MEKPAMRPPTEEEAIAFMAQEVESTLEALIANGALIPGKIVLLRGISLEPREPSDDPVHYWDTLDSPLQGQVDQLAMMTKVFEQRPAWVISVNPFLAECPDKHRIEGVAGVVYGPSGTRFIATRLRHDGETNWLPPEMATMAGTPGPFGLGPWPIGPDTDRHLTLEEAVEAAAPLLESVSQAFVADRKPPPPCGMAVGLAERIGYLGRLQPHQIDPSHRNQAALTRLEPNTPAFAAMYRAIGADYLVTLGVGAMSYGGSPAEVQAKGKAAYRGERPGDLQILALFSDMKDRVHMVFMLPMDSPEQGWRPLRMPPGGLPMAQVSPGLEMVQLRRGLVESQEYDS